MPIRPPGGEPRGHVPITDQPFDLLVIGSGGAAFAAAVRADELGASVALVESGTVGGTCVNVGCVPSKTLLAAAAARHTASGHPFEGVETRAGKVDLAALVAQKDTLVGTLRAERYVGAAGVRGIPLLSGHARFVSPGEVVVGDLPVPARTHLIATGAEPRVPADVRGIHETGYLTSTTALQLDHVPRSVAVIGAGYVGMELAQLFARLGSDVTVIGRPAPRAEPELAGRLADAFAAESIEIVRRRAVAAERRADARVVVLDDGGTVTADEILVAAGRSPRVDDLGLSKAGILTDEGGSVQTDEEQRTSNPAVFAAGDVTAGPQFVYAAARQGAVAAENALTGSHVRVDYTGLPSVLFTSPQLASTGMTDDDAVAAGIECECRVLDLALVPRAIIEHAAGAVKIVADRQTRRVLGVHVLAEGAGDVIQAGVYAVRFGLTVDDVAQTWAPYLTMSEALRLAAQSFDRDVSKLSCCAG